MPSLVLLQRDHEASPRLSALIEAFKRFQVIGAVHTVEAARGLVAQTRPDILVTDTRVQDGDVHDFLLELRQTPRALHTHILVTAMSHDDALLLEAVRTGADGYWVHAHATDELIDTLDRLARGESPISPTIARAVLAHFDAREPSGPDSATEALNPFKLTVREKEILQWVAQGYLLDEIARQWQASVHSVACGIRRVYHKLQFDLRANGLSLKAA